MPRGWAWFMRLVLAVSLFALVFLALARSFQAVHSGSVEDLRLSRGGSSGEHFADDDRAATYSNDDRAAAHFTSTTAMSAAAAGDRDRDTAQETPSLRVQLSAAEQRQLSALSNEWKTVLRALPSHFSEDADDGGNAAASATGAALDADKYGGRKHVVMQELKNMLVPGVSAELLWESMGDPDEVTSDLDNPYQSPSFMPGPVIADSTTGITPTEPYALYYWRGRHDFLWFKLGDGDTVVHSSGWYEAGE